MQKLSFHNFTGPDEFSAKAALDGSRQRLLPEPADGGEVGGKNGMSLAPDCDRAAASIETIVLFLRHRLLQVPILPLAEAAGIGAKAI